MPGENHTPPWREGPYTDIHELDLTASEALPDLSGIVYTNEQDLLRTTRETLTDAGLLDAYYGKVFERLYVGEQMAQMVYEVRRSLTGRILALVPGEIATDTASSLRHEGGADLVLAAVHVLPAEKHWRGAVRLYKVAARILLGRAKARLANNPGDREARVLVRDTRQSLTRHPDNGKPRPSGESRGA